MNFSELQQIVKYLRKTLPCSHCQSSYDNEGIEVLSTFDDQGLFNLNCPKCKHQLLVHITISDEEKNLSDPEKANQQTIRAHRSINDKDITASFPVNQISTNDVIDMHTFLNQFNGDFKKLFSNKI